MILLTQTIHGDGDKTVVMMYPNPQTSFRAFFKPSSMKKLVIHLNSDSKGKKNLAGFSIDLDDVVREGYNFIEFPFF